MKRFHIAIGVKNLDESIADYSARLGMVPEAIVPETYARWRTDTLNFTISVREEFGHVRHLCWEDDNAKEFSDEKDPNGILWQCFPQEEQIKEGKRIYGTFVDYETYRKQKDNK